MRTPDSEKSAVLRTQVQEARAQLADLIRDKMEREGLETITDFADKYELGRSTLYELVRGRSRTRGAWVHPSLQTTIALARALERPLHEIIYLLEPNAPGAEATLASDAPLLKVNVEVAGWVGAGPAQDSEAQEPPIWVDLNFARGKELRAFRVSGDSMAAGKRPILDGDIVIVDVLDKGYNTASVVARLADDSYVVKMLKQDRYERQLQSRNPEHTNGTPSVIPISEVAEIVGRVVKIIAEIKGEGLIERSR
jgi:repressor LexA